MRQKTTKQKLPDSMPRDEFVAAMQRGRVNVCGTTFVSEDGDIIRVYHAMGPRVPKSKIGQYLKVFGLRPELVLGAGAAG